MKITKKGCSVAPKAKFCLDVRPGVKNGMWTTWIISIIAYLGNSRIACVEMDDCIDALIFPMINLGIKTTQKRNFVKEQVNEAAVLEIVWRDTFDPVEFNLKIGPQYHSFKEVDEKVNKLLVCKTDTYRGAPAQSA